MAEFASKLALAIFRLNEVVETEKTPLYLSNFDTGLEITVVMNKKSNTYFLGVEFGYVSGVGCIPRRYLQVIP